MNNLTDEEIKNRIATKVKKLYAKKNKKYVCEFCGTGFDKRDFLISHMKIRHPDDYELKYGESNYASLNPNILSQLNGENSPSSANNASSSAIPSTMIASNSNSIDNSNNSNSSPNPSSQTPPMGQTSIPNPMQNYNLDQQTQISRNLTPHSPQNNHLNSSPNTLSSPSNPSNAQFNTTLPNMASSVHIPDMSTQNLDVNTLTPAEMLQIENQLDRLNSALGKTMKVLEGNIMNLNKELRYLISEYKSPFIIFDD